MAPGSLLIKDVRIFTGDAFIDHGFVLVENGKITRVGSGPPEPVPSGVHVLSRPGDTLLPGIVDGHIHADRGNLTSVEQSLRFGVTTVCDMGNEFKYTDNLKRLSTDPANAGKYADFKFCGEFATVVPGGWPAPVVTLHDKSPETLAWVASWPKIETAADAQGFVERQVQAGASYIKIMCETGEALVVDGATLPMEIQKAVVEAAHAHRVPIVAHALSYRGALEALESGVDGTTHMFVDEPPSDEWVRLYKGNRAHCNPTLAATGSLTTEGKQLQARFAQEPLARRMLLKPEDGERMCRCMSMAADKISVKTAYKSVRTLYEAGVPIILGSDSAGPALGTAYGLSAHMEMHLLRHEVGMSALDVLRAATSVTADRLGLTDRGRLEAGKKGDMVLVEGDVGKFLDDKDGLCMPLKSVWKDGVMAEVWKDA